MDMIVLIKKIPMIAATLPPLRVSLTACLLSGLKNESVVADC